MKYFCASAKAGFFLTAVFIAGCATFPSANGLKRPRNVIVISIDTLRADHLGSYGYTKDTSPQIDALARAGTVYENAHTNSTLTIQSHMSMLTGLLPTSHHVLDFLSPKERLSENIPTLMEILHKNGFETFWFAGQNSPMLSGRLGYDRGQTFFTQSEFTSEEGPKLITKWAEGKHEKPFFVFMHAWLCHSPYLTVKPYSAKFTLPNYKGRVLVDSEEFQKELAHTDLAKLDFPPANHPLFSKAIWRGDFVLNPFEKFYWSRINFQHPEDFLQLGGAYDNTINYTDFLLGNLLAQLKERGLLEDTLVILTSDHGEELYEHKGLNHFTHYEEILRVPLILSGPGAGKGVRVKAPVQEIDLVPTVLDRLGIAFTSGEFDGVPLPLAEPPKNSRPFFAYTKRSQQEQMSVEVNGRKLIKTSGEPDELYDLESDPREIHPLKTEKYPVAYSELMQQLLHFLSYKK